ncbi:hemolysin XhlA [Romboutsia ilealis]|uniref:Hemolysin XhlA family protein n=1 Tax=Romboutsia faecis TaxID=2764597 RepID=A0ABR7JPV3_9FIRM|nr:hemolysin XhlA family protein [Romboutsia faecis]MBC5996947.1 hemolysin XhlA family protein [Romboutsia faecis]MRN24551.1 hemolysin XhlA [Romboutsia ilealis]
MADDTLQEVRERLIKIEVLLENMNKNSELKNEILEEKIKVANNRISDLENSNTWLWRAIAGALISSVIAFLIK